MQNHQDDPPPPQTDARDDPPDGGEGWKVVFGSTLALFATTGVINAYGFFQSFYTDYLLDDSSSTTIAFIGALQISLVYAGGPISGRIFDAYGIRPLLPIGSFLVVLSIMLTSILQRNRPYQFFLVQGILSGVGNSMLFTPSLAVIGHWFKRRRSYALGIVVAGSSLGGVVYPIILSQLKHAVGFPWAVRICGFLTMICLLVTNLTISSRVQPSKEVGLAKLIDLAGFRDLRYVLAIVGSMLYFFALFIPYFYIEEYAKFYGVDPRVASFLLALINGCGVPARVIPGLLADTYGIIKILAPATFLSGVFVLALWLPAKTPSSIVAFSALYGLCSSSFVSMLPAYITSITPVANIGGRLGIVYFHVAIACLAGTPAAGAFVPEFSEKNFNRLIIFTGVMLIASSVFIGGVGLVKGRDGMRGGEGPVEVEEEKDGGDEEKRDLEAGMGGGIEGGVGTGTGLGERTDSTSVGETDTAVPSMCRALSPFLSSFLFFTYFFDVLQHP
ncbi:hypothetical protein M422DRAFT_156691 [Sphaerobolus stellatus SS14]|nr:hypothetical protein M422DRAFT_156691 [Sphaerobolus stellatus SS14]